MREWSSRLTVSGWGVSLDGDDGLGVSLVSLSARTKNWFGLLSRQNKITNNITNKTHRRSVFIFILVSLLNNAVCLGCRVEMTFVVPDMRSEAREEEEERRHEGCLVQLCCFGLSTISFIVKPQHGAFLDSWSFAPGLNSTSTLSVVRCH